LNIADWAGTAASIAAVAAGIVAATTWLLRTWLKGYMYELKPNGGSSLKDSVNKIAADMTELRISVARLEGRFNQHVDEVAE
jgi:hypothetical protein